MWLHWSSWQTHRNFFFKHLFRNISVAKWIASRCQLKDSSTLKTIPHYTLHKSSITNSKFKSNISAISLIASYHIFLCTAESILLEPPFLLPPLVTKATQWFPVLVDINLYGVFCVKWDQQPVSGQCIVDILTHYLVAHSVWPTCLLWNKHEFCYHQHCTKSVPHSGQARNDGVLFHNSVWKTSLYVEVPRPWGTTDVLRIWPDNRKNPRDPRRSGKCAISILAYKCIWYENLLPFSLCVIKTIFSKTGEDPTHWPWEYLQKSVCFPLSLFIYVRPWQQCLLCLPHALPHIPNLKQNRDPARQLYKGRPSKCAFAKRVHLRLARKRWQKVRWGSKKGGKKCHSSSKGTRTRGKVGPVIPVTRVSYSGRGGWVDLIL